MEVRLYAVLRNEKIKHVSLQSGGFVYSELSYCEIYNQPFSYEMVIWEWWVAQYEEMVTPPPPPPPPLNLCSLQYIYIYKYILMTYLDIYTNNVFFYSPDTLSISQCNKLITFSHVSFYMHKITHPHPNLKFN